jgi:CheY-like chemotaxis protein
MNNISILIADDDLNKISVIIKTIKEKFSGALMINQASCVQEAIEYLQKKEYHLLITDLQMPLRNGDAPDDSGGKTLLKNIYRARTNVNVPMYIIGLTQFDELKTNFKGAWQVWSYDSSIENWKIDLRDLIHHISLVKSKILVHKIETLFVEGATDRKIIECTIKNYYADYEDKIYIESISYGGGAAWITRKLHIWAKSLTLKNNSDIYLKAIGIFDDDDAGRVAIGKIRRDIPCGTADSKTFHIKKNCYKYSPLLKSIKSKGIIIPTTLEELISIDCWNQANEKGWLIKRDLSKIEIETSKINVSKVDLNDKILNELGFTIDERLIILNKLEDKFKSSFCNLACTEKPDVLINISYQLKDIFETLKINN